MKSNQRALRSESVTNRRFGTTDLAIVLALWSAMAVVLGGVLSELAADSDSPLAKAQSEAYALQMAESVSAKAMPMKSGMTSGMTSGVTSGARGPASAQTLSASPGAMKDGSFGKDPWGNPYHYRVVNSGVVVWSYGKNAQSDSDREIDRLTSGQTISDFHFAGDDVGYLKVSHNER